MEEVAIHPKASCDVLLFGYVYVQIHCDLFIAETTTTIVKVIVSGASGTRREHRDRSRLTSES